MSDKKNTNDLIYTLNDIMEERFGRYAKYIIQDRALPDVRDGLKPVQRRILFAMNELRLTFNTSYKKSARIVGEVIGKYHPHGDTSVYDAMVRLSQSWKVRYPLIDMHGNNGSIDGDPAAAMRYTETRLSEISSFLLQDLDKDTVLFAPNFDDSEQEPVVLPGLFPHLLINGSTGIAAGYATNIPPHNLHEIIDATIAFINKPNCKVQDLAKYIKGPDFPTGGIIQGISGILEAYETGKGKIIVRSTITNEDNNLVITEIPYEVVKQDLVKKIDDIKYNEPGLSIKEVRDETDRTGLRIVVELAKQANYETVRKFLLKNTNLQVSYNFNIVGIANKQPRQMGIKEILTYYITHQREVVTNRSKYDLARAEKRSEIVNGLIKTISILDEVISTIRHSQDRNDAIKNLCEKFNFTFVQSEAIVQLRLYRLTSTDILQLEEEQRELQVLITELKLILSDANKLNTVIIEQLELIKKRFDSKRRSIIEDEIEIIEIEKTETIIEKDINIWISRDGYLKAIENSQLAKITTEEFKRKPYDIWIADFQANTLDKILLVTSKGNYVIIPVYKIKISRIKDIGEHVNTISELPGEEKIISAFLLDDFNKIDYYLMLATKNAMIKKTAIKDFEATRISKAIKAINLKGDDELVACQLVNKQPYVVIGTANGFAVKYKTTEIPTLGLKTAGVKAINLKEDVVVNANYCSNENLIFVTNINTIKKIAVSELPVSTRPIKGMRLFKENKKISEEIKWLFITKPKDIFQILHMQDEIEMFNTDKLAISKINSATNSFGIENINEVVIPRYYDLKAIPSQIIDPIIKSPEPKKPAMNKTFTKKPALKKPTAKKETSSSTTIKKDSSEIPNDDDTHPKIISNYIDVDLPFNNIVSNSRLLESTRNNDLTTDKKIEEQETEINSKSDEISQFEKAMVIQKKSQLDLSEVNQPGIINENKTSVLFENKTEVIRNVNLGEVDKKQPEFNIKKFGKVQTTAEIIIYDRKNRAEIVKTIIQKEKKIKKDFLQNMQEKEKTDASMELILENEIIQDELISTNKQVNHPITTTLTERLTKIEQHHYNEPLIKPKTTIEFLLEEKKQHPKIKKIEIKEELKIEEVLIPLDATPVNGRTEFLKKLEKAPAGTMNFGLKTGPIIKEEKKIIKVDFMKEPPGRIDKNKFKKDLTIDTTKELEVSFADLLNETNKDDEQE